MLFLIIIATPENHQTGSNELISSIHYEKQKMFFCPTFNKSVGYGISNEAWGKKNLAQ